MYVYICIYIYMCIYTVCVYVYICIYVYIYICMYIYISIYWLNVSNLQQAENTVCHGWALNASSMLYQLSYAVRSDGRLEFMKLILKCM